MKSFHTIPILGCLLAVTALATASPDVNRKRLERDLRIMEGVLDKLFQDTENHIFREGGTRGLHIPGYGVLFHTRPGSVYLHTDIRLERYREDIRILAERVREETEGLVRPNSGQSAVQTGETESPGETEPLRGIHIRVPRSDHARPETIIRKEKESLESFRKRITQFFESYVSAIGQLEPEHRIAVLIDLKDWEMTDTESAFLTSWVRKQDIDGYRQGKVPAEDFRQSIHFDLAESGSDIDMDIGILTEILVRALDTSSHAMSSLSGIYLAGLGAVLFMDMPGLRILGKDAPISVIISDRAKRTIARGYGEFEDSDADHFHIEDRTERIQDELFELIASYGHTLRIRPEERIILSVNLGSGFLHWGGESKSPSRLMLQLRKEDVDEYSRGLLSLEELRSRAVIQAW